MAGINPIADQIIEYLQNDKDTMFVFMDEYCQENHGVFVKAENFDTISIYKPEVGDGSPWITLKKCFTCNFYVEGPLQSCIVCGVYLCKSHECVFCDVEVCQDCMIDIKGRRLCPDCYTTFNELSED